MRCTLFLRMALLAVTSLFCALHPQSSIAQASADFNVNSVADKVDANPGDGICSTGTTIDGHTPECTLRGAIDEVNALSAVNPSRIYTVAVMAGTYSLTTSETCIYRDNGNPNPLSTTTSVLCVNANVTLNGAAEATTIVDHALVDRDFFVSAGFNVAINNMTIQNGGQYGGSFDGGGGGINNQANLSLSNDTFFRNHSDVGGAGVDNSGTLVVDGCTFLANSGPGISANYSTASINNSYFTQNTAYQGPAIASYVATISISNSTATANTVGENGIIGLYNSVSTISNTTISNNTVGNAGALVASGNGGSLTLNNVTVAGNTAGNSIGGMFSDYATISNSIFAGNTGFDCAVGALTDLGHNLVQVFDQSLCTITDPTTLTGIDAKLGTVALDGGSIPTQSPLPGSPTIGAGSPLTPGSNKAGACTAIDERGFVRGSQGACTMGAVEPLGGLQINNVSPNVGAPGGTAWIVVHGNGFVPGSTLAVQVGGQSLPLLQSTVAPDTFSITALLDLGKATLGKYSAVVTTPSGASTTFSAAYTVQKPIAPLLYSYVYGPGAVHAGRPGFYSVVYGNNGNADAYLVPLTLALPGDFAGLISSSILNPPVATGQAIQDWTSVPVEVKPYSTTGFSNVPLIIPVIPAGATGVIQFSITAPSNTAEDTRFEIGATIGNPYSAAVNGAADPTTVAEFVAGAKSYAQANLGVTLTSSELAQMSTYATSQLAQEVALGGQALLESAAGSPVIFSNSQLLVDIATYGASRATSGSSAASTLRTRLRAFSVHPDSGSAPTSSPTSNPCSGGSLLTGASCTPVATVVPTPISVTFTAADCADLPGHYVSANGLFCLVVVTTSSNPSAPGVAPPLPIVGSVDPNEKDGPLGIGAAHFTVADDPFRYQVEFENTPTATAPAQTVSVTDPLDTTQYDLSTFELGPISFGPYVLTPPPGLTSFSSAVDLRPTENVIVTVRASLDMSTGIASWNFTSLDPATMQLVTDPIAGFLPPDANPPAGIGHVTFSVKPLAAVASGAKICNTASVVFDTNAAIATAPFCNSKDTTAPISAVQPLPATESSPTFTVSWKGSDAGVGVAYYTIYVSIDSGAFAAWQSMITTMSASYIGSIGHTYGFYSIAADLLGNIEGPKSSAEATTTVGTNSPAATPAFSPKAGVYNSTQTVAISDTTPSATIYYTSNGSMPTTQSAVYIGPVSVNSTETLQAFAVAAGYTQSTVATAMYTITPASVTAPTFSPAGGTFSTAQTVKLADMTTGATIYYTTDGTDPDANSPVYSSPVHVTMTETIKAIAIASITSSPVASATYTIAPSQCQTIDYSHGFTASGLSLNGGATLTSNNLLQLTDGGFDEARSAFYTTAVPVTSYTTDFTFQLLNPLADGITFTIQSTSPQAVGQPGGGLGYAGIPNSVALKLDLFDNAGEGFDSTGLYFNGAYPSTPAISLLAADIHLHSGHIFAVHLTYANDKGTGTITDTVTGQSASMSVPGDLSKVVGDTAYVGFTGGTGALTAMQNILTWTYSGGVGCSAK